MSDSRLPRNWLIFSLSFGVVFYSVVDYISTHSQRMFRRFFEVVGFDFDNWFVAAPGNPFVEADAVVQRANGGDLIEFQRKKCYLFPYKHWAVYIGHRETIGVGVPDKRKESQIEKKMVSDLCVLKCRVNNLEEAATRRRLTAFPNDRVVDRALKCFNISIKYNVRDNNCEHFATFCRYGFPLSMQVYRFPGRLRSDSEILEFATRYALQFSRAI